VLFQISSITVDGGTALEQYSETIRRHLVPLLVNCLNTLIEQKTGIAAHDLFTLTVDETVITVGY
jgi:hypothetical protein